MQGICGNGGSLEAPAGKGPQSHLGGQGGGAGGVEKSSTEAKELKLILLYNLKMHFSDYISPVIQYIQNRYYLCNVSFKFYVKIGVYRFGLEQCHATLTDCDNVTHSHAM